MKTVEDSVDVAVPVSTAYNQWTQFERFPEFMSGVERVTQLTGTRTHWQTKVTGVRREFDAEITEQHPDERVAWHTLDGPYHAGVVTFHRLDGQNTRVTLQMEFDPEGVAEKVSAALGVVDMQSKGDVKSFEEFIESEVVATGAWRGEVPPPHAGPEAGGTPPPGGTPAPGSTPPPGGAPHPGEDPPGMYGDARDTRDRARGGPVLSRARLGA